MSVHPDVRFTLGAVLAGALFSTALSGALCLQIFLYIRHYPNDPFKLKALVALVWAMDTAHTCTIAVLAYQYMILNFANTDIIDHAFGTIPAALALTLPSIVLSRIDFIYMLSITVLTIRVATAFVTVAELSMLQSFSEYGARFRPLLTTGLALSAFIDILLTLGLCYYLRSLRRGLGSTIRMMSTIVNFSDNNGLLTCVIALAALACWVIMPTNLIYLGLHFTIGKFYSNSLLTTLNMRDYVKRAYPMRSETHTPWPGFSASGASSEPMYDEDQTKYNGAPAVDPTLPLEIKVDTMVHYD
ncbi:hypothetical protein BC834DRAFT_965655 [Gloeopeniophorella convolvens]|nr:hypothetical protein BC834DRAFT_965655 [Gloeopeniophorella convolvens]